MREPMTCRALLIDVAISIVSAIIVFALAYGAYRGGIWAIEKYMEWQDMRYFNDATTGIIQDSPLPQKVIRRDYTYYYWED